MMGLLLTAFGLLATVVGWRVVWRVRAVAKRISRHYNGPQVPAWARRTAPWRAIPVVGEAVLVWNRRARLAKLLALPLLAFGPVVTALGVLLLVHEVRGHHGSDVTPHAPTRQVRSEAGKGALQSVDAVVARCVILGEPICRCLLSRLR